MIPFFMDSHLTCTNPLIKRASKIEKYRKNQHGIVSVIDSLNESNPIVDY